MVEAIPRDPAKNAALRIELLEAAAGDATLRRGLLELCAADVKLWVNLFVWAYDPRLAGAEVGPFCTYEFQDEAFDALAHATDHGEDLVVEKSRDMGASWCCELHYVHRWLFRPWQKFLVISRNEDAVDKPGDPDSLFWKIDHVLERLPHWMLSPKDYVRRKLSFTHKNGSTIIGQASTGKAGVGGRATGMLIDEFSQIAEDDEVLGKTADVTKNRVFNFTHTGVGTAAYRIATSGLFKKLVMHWSAHPKKNPGLYRFDPATNQIEVLDKKYLYPPGFKFVLSEAPTGGPFPGVRSPWYDAEVPRRGSPRQVAMDLDIDAKGSGSQFFQPMVVHQLMRTVARPPDWVGDLRYDRESGEPLSLVESPAGWLRLWFTPGPNMEVPPGEYAMGADVAAGTGATPTCVSVCRVETGEKFAEWASPFVVPEDAGVMAAALGRVFRNAYFAWEQHGPGLLFGKRVIESGYRRVYYNVNDFKEEVVVSDTPGWYPHPKSKRLLLEEYRSALASGQFVNYSGKALEETLKFVYTDRGNVEHGGEASRDDPSGARENHGDRVIADALAWKMAAELGAGRPSLADRAKKDEPGPNTLAGRRAMWEQERRRKESWG
ncbi:MAG TPA: hypothetical protein VM529_24905 [Gemmata sp.]|jgi:hypothetical protein|nr:hypothetical protein [Gemmata sp.]